MGLAGKGDRRSMLVPIIFILLLFGFPFFFFGGPGYHADRSFKAAWDLGHIGFFFLASWLGITLFGSVGQKRTRWLFFTCLFSLVLVVGGTVELVQQATGGRMVGGWDLYRNQLGCLAAFTLTGWLPISRKGNLVLLSIVIGLLFAAIWPIYHGLVDEQTARSQFPVLADFETPFEQNRWKDVRQLQRQKKIVRHGQYGLRVQLSTATYSGTSLFYFPRDWRDYKWLHFSVYNPEDEYFFLHCRIHDTLHAQHGMRFDDRFHRRFELHPGWNDLVISLQDIRTAPASRLMDMAQIEGFGVFVVRQQRARVIYFDYMYLNR